MGGQTNTNNVVQPQNRRPAQYQQFQQAPSGQKAQPAQPQPLTQKPQQPQVLPYTSRPQPQVRPLAQNPQPSQNGNSPVAHPPAAQSTPVAATRPAAQPASNVQSRHAPAVAVAQNPPAETQLSSNSGQQGSAPGGETDQGRSSRRREIIIVERNPATPPPESAPTNPSQPAATQGGQKPDFAAILNGFANVIAAAKNTPAPSASESPKTEKATLETPPTVDPKLMAGAFHQLASAERDKAVELIKNKQDTEASAAMTQAQKMRTPPNSLKTRLSRAHPPPPSPPRILRADFKRFSNPTPLRKHSMESQER